jgi:hypothetical protein
LIENDDENSGLMNINTISISSGTFNNPDGMITNLCLSCVLIKITDTDTDMNFNKDSDACTDSDGHTDADTNANALTDIATNSDTDSLDSDCSIEITGFSHDLIYDDAILHGEPLLLSEHSDSNASDSDVAIESEDSPGILSELHDLPDYDSDSNINAEFFATLEVLNNLRDQLLGGYKPPDECPPDIKTGMDIDKLSLDEKRSLQHFVAWKKIKWNC